MIHFSPSTLAFYASEIAYPGGIPSDAIEVSEQEHRSVIDSQSFGTVLAADANGRPALVPVPDEVWDSARSRALTLLRKERAPVLSALDGLQSTASTAGLSSLLAGNTAEATTHSAKAQQIEALKQGLRDAPVQIDFAACTNFEQMRMAGKAYYASLVAGAPADVVAAFKVTA
jgi:hypothetical protein